MAAPIVPLHPDVADGLALAMISSSDAPVLLLDERLSIIAASVSFCRAFDFDPSAVRGRRLSELGDREWDIPQVGSLLRATAAGAASVDAYEMDLNRPGAPPLRLVLHAHKLEYGDEDNVRVLLTVTDVTDARRDAKLKDDLIREKAILMQELQHRIANSLQIISSVLLQSASNSKSPEAQGHLRDANNRMMSVAAVQKQLSVTTLGEVKLAPYLKQLCESIGASMIRDPKRISLTVAADETATSSSTSISLGLIVTELVINALKHAFPDDRAGKITVGYFADATSWTLTVRDDGVGMPSTSKPGLGTSIVEALAKQLMADVEVTQGLPGTTVAIEYPASARSEP